MFARTLLVVVGVALSARLSIGVAYSQAPAGAAADSATRARALLDDAERAYREARYREAAAAFLSADRLQPTPAIQLALGRTYEQLSDPSRALAAYREYFVRSPRASDRAEVQGHVADLAARLAEHGVQQISVSSVPAGATVVVDAKTLGTTPIYVDLPPGPHHLEFHLLRYDSASLDFELSPQQPLNVMTTLVLARGVEPGGPVAAVAATPKLAPAAPKPAPAAPPPAPVAAPPAPNPSAPPPPAPPAAPEPAVTAEAPPAPSPNLSAPARPAHAQPQDETTRWMRTAGFAAVGGSVAALGAAVAFELLRSQSESRARQTRQQIVFKETFDTMQTQQTVARAFAITAGVLAAAGGVLLVLSAERNEAASPNAGVALVCLPTACNATYQGVF